jgi:DHA3 family tetracycline resistance protein-like MFS transporter
MRPGAYPVWLALTCAESLINSMVFTYAAVYYVRDAGLGPFQLVLVGTVMEAAIFCFEVPTGVVADRFGRRLSVIVAFAVQGAAFVVLALEPTTAGVLAASALWGFGWTFESGALQAWIVDELGGRDLQRVFLRGSRWAYAGAFVGLVAGAALAALSLRLTIAVGGIGLLVLAAVLALVMPERGFRPQVSEVRFPFRDLTRSALEAGREVRAHPVLRLIVTITFFFGAFTEGIDRLGEIHYLRDVGLPEVGSLDPVVWFSVMGLVGLASSFFLAGALARRIAPERGLNPSRTLLVLDSTLLAGVLVFALTDSFAVAFAAMWVARRARALHQPIFDAWLNENVTSERRATVLSIANQADAIGQVGGGPILGAVGSLVSIRAALATSALLIAPALGVYARALRRPAPEPPLEEAAPG